MHDQESAERYVRDCLAIMDGTTEAGIARIGTQKFEQIVKEVLKAFPKRSKHGSRKD